MNLHITKRLITHMQYSRLVNIRCNKVHGLLFTKFYCQQSPNNDPDIFGTLALKNDPETSKQTFKGDLKPAIKSPKEEDQVKFSKNQSNDFNYVSNLWKDFDKRSKKNKKKQYKQKNKSSKNSFDTKTFGKLSGVKDVIDMNRKGVKQDLKLLEKIKKAKETPDDFGTLNTIRGVMDIDSKYFSYADYADEQHLKAVDAPKLTIDEYTQKIKKFLQEQKLAEALNVLEEEMPSVFVKPNQYMFRILITSCGKVGYTEKAFQLYKLLKSHGITPHPNIYTSLFNACGNCPTSLMKSSGLNKAIYLRKELQEKQVILNQIGYHAMIKAFGRCGDISTAFEIVDEMLTEKVLINHETVAFLLQACISDKDVGFRHALQVWRKMRFIKAKPSIYVYNLLLECIEKCKAGEQEFYSDLLNFQEEVDKKRINRKKTENLLLPDKKNLINIDIKSISENQTNLNKNENHINLNEHYKYFVHEDQNKEKSSENKQTELQASMVLATLPNVLGQTASIGTVTQIKSLDKPSERFALCGGSVGILHQMKLDKVQPNIKTFTSMIKSVPDSFSNELDVLEQMEKHNIPPDLPFFNIFINKCVTRFDYPNAKEAFGLMAKYKISPDFITFGILSKIIGAHTYGTKRIVEFKKFLKDINSLNIRPNITTFDPMLQRALYQSDFKSAKFLMDNIVSWDVKPDEKMVRKLEKYRLQFKEEIIRLERRNDLSEEESKKYEDLFNYMKEYGKFLKATEIDIEPHPWEHLKLQT